MDPVALGLKNHSAGEGQRKVDSLHTLKGQGSFLATLCDVLLHSTGQWRSCGEAAPLTLVDLMLTGFNALMLKNIKVYLI
jgi:hypothetical protein